MSILASLTAVGVAGYSPAPQTTLPAAPPTVTTDVGRWDAELVQRAAKLLVSPAKWDRHRTPSCGAAKTFTISCALERTVEESAGIWRDPSGKRLQQTPALSDCRFDAAGDGLQGSCGALFDEVPVFTISRAKATTTGRWRADAQPDEVWVGMTSDAEYPVMEEAGKTVGLVSAQRYAAPLDEYNSDPATTFTDVQAFFRRLEDQVIKHATADLADNDENVEIEIYAGGAGVIRTYAGWYPVSGASLHDSTLRFLMDADHEVPPNGLDREILRRANALIASDGVWNRADNRKCPAAETTWSIYCAEERASIDVTGGFHHRRPALELVRQIIDERTKGKQYHHREMDYNNDPSTHLDDLRTLFADAIARIK
ncbi:MAG TPA: hypothetical protein VGL62_00460 [Vicinamibacterales bacterium]